MNILRDPVDCLPPVAPAPDHQVGYVVAGIRTICRSQSKQSGKTELSLKVFGASIVAGEATVVDGNFTVTEVQPNGQTFNGDLVSFTVGGRSASQTSIWKTGGADIVDLIAK